MARCELIFTYRLRAETFVNIELAGSRRILQFENRTCSFGIPLLEPGVADASRATDGRLHASKDGKIAIVAIRAVQVGASVNLQAKPDAIDLATLVDDTRPVADRLAMRMLALLGSRGRQYSLGLVEQDLAEALFPVLVGEGGRETKIERPRPGPSHAAWDHRSVSTQAYNSFLDDIAAGSDLHEVFRLLADAYFLCFRSSLVELRHAALLGATACEVASQQLIRQLSSQAQLPVVDALLSRKPHVAFIFNEACFAVRGKRLRDELPDVSRRLEELQSYRNMVAHEGALPSTINADQIRDCIDAALQAIEWLRSA